MTGHIDLEATLNPTSAERERLDGTVDGVASNTAHDEETLAEMVTILATLDRNVDAIRESLAPIATTAESLDADPSAVAVCVVTTCRLFGRGVEASPAVCTSIEETVDEYPVTGDALFAVIERVGPAARAHEYSLSDLLETIGEASREAGPEVAILSRRVREEIDG